MTLERRIRNLEGRAGPDPTRPLAVVETDGRRFHLLPGGRLEPEASEPTAPLKLYRGLNLEDV